MNLPSFPNLTGLVVKLQFLRQTEFNLMHEMAVDAFLRYLLNIGEQYTHHFSIITPENGRLHYRQDDSYRFAIIAQGNSTQLNPLWQKLISQLQNLPNSAPVTDKGVPLKDNVKLIGLQDLFDGIPLTSEKSLDAYTENRAIEQAQSWFNNGKLNQQSLTIQLTWQSITRLLKSNHKKFTNEQRFCRDKHDLTPHLLLKRIYETLSNLSRQFGGKITPETTELQHHWLEQQAKFISIEQADLYWIDTPYFNKNKQANPLGGLAGNLTLTLQPGTEPGILGLLILGQTVGIGQRRTSGFGKYRLKHNLTKSYLQLGLQNQKLTRSQSLLEQLLQPHFIDKASLLIETKNSKNKLTAKSKQQLKSAIGQLKAQQYNAPFLRGFTQPKKDGSERLLAVSPLYDRILQKSASLILTPGLDAMMSQSSYGYRKGLSRQQVRYEIQNAYREGYKWVYESDIEDFFDSINRPQLINRLKALYGEDPLWKVLNDWLGKNIHIKHTIIERETHQQGIPQGSPLSPLLANFILDDFDSDLETYGFKIIRYADDFIILCKTKHQAEQAAELVKKSLDQVQLSINRDKTHIIELDQGFRFLGYLFRSDHAIEIGGNTDGKHTYSAEEPPSNLPPWLANIGLNQPKPLDEDQLPKQKIGKIEEQGTHLILAGDAQFISTDNHNIIVKKDDIITHKINWEQLHAITLIGLHHMTLPTQHQAMQNRIPVHMADRTGNYLGALTSFQPAQNSYKDWFIQLQISDNIDYALALAKNIVIARVHNQRHTLLKRQAHRQQLQNALIYLERIQRKIKNAQNLASLNGYEGSATRLYFKQFNLFLPKWAQFQKRSRRPPADSFNVLLSLGYTILYSHVDSILQSAGFMTWKGVYHQQSPAHAALASDIMESYRHIIEKFAIYSINQNQIKETDFRQETDEHGKKNIRLSAEARRRYVAGIINRFQRFSKQQTLHQHLYQQAQQLKHSMQNQQAKLYQAWKETK